MSERARNIAVGVTVLVAIGMLCTMVLLFTVVPAVFQSGYTVPIMAESTLDVEPGFKIHFAGIPVGHIADVRFVDAHDPTRGVIFTALIQRDIRLPGNTRVVIFTKGFVGSAYVEMKADGPWQTDRKTGQRLALLPTDGSISLRAEHLGSSLIPDEIKNSLEDIRQGFKELGALAKNLNDVIAPTPATGGGEPATQIAGQAATSPVGPNMRGMLAKLDKTLDGLSVIVGDPENQANIKVAMTNLAKASGQAVDVMKDLKDFLGKADGIVGKAGQNFDQLTKKLLDGTDKLATLLTALNQIAEKLQTSDGTAGKLLNDPKLYNNLLDITTQLTSLMKDFRVLLQTWEQQGVGIKLK